MGRHLADVRFAPYATEEIIEQVRKIDPLQYPKWISTYITFTRMAITKWIKSALPASSVAFKDNSLVPMRQAAQAGMSIALLP